MNWYWIFYLLTIVENFTTALLATWIVAMLSAVTFFVVWLTNKHNVIEGYEKHKNGYILWEKLGYKIFKNSLIIFITTLMLFLFIPSRTGVMLIIAGGAIGEFVTSNEDVKEIPAELATWFKAQIEVEVQELRNLPIKESIKDMTREELQKELLEIKIKETQLE